MNCILLVFALSQGGQCLLEVRSMPNRHRIRTNCVRTNPPIVSLHSDFFWSDVVRVVFVRQLVHLTTYFFIATDVKHILAELRVADEPVVDTQEVLLLAFLLERIRDVVLVIPWLLSVTVPVGSPFLYVVIGNREEIHGVRDKFFCSPPFRFARSARTCNRRCQRPNMIVPTSRIISFDSWLKGLNG